MKSKALLLAVAAMVLAMPVNAQKKGLGHGMDAYGERTAGNDLLKLRQYNGASGMHKADGEDTPTVEELLGCPEGTVFGVSDADYTNIGNSTADLGRPNYGASFYQAFSGNYYKFHGLRFLGVFKYFDYDEYNWFYCTGRGNMDDNAHLRDSISFDIGFYKRGANGLPGEQVYKKTIKVLGNRTDVYLGDDVGGYGYIYEFTAQLGEELSLESGFFSVGATDMGDSPSCWFCMFNANSSAGAAYYKFSGSDSYTSTFLPAVYCFEGDGTLAASKGLKIERMLSPTSVNDGKYARVQVELTNIGKEAVNDATLELYEDNKLLATEKVGANIESQDYYKYTFKQRVDLSEVGVHEITVKNVTPGDEKLADESLSKTFTKNAAGEPMPSYSESCDYSYTTEVKIGTIDNKSEATSYSDYTNLKTNFSPKDSLAIDIYGIGYGYIAAWIDWDGDGTFSVAEQIALNYGRTESGYYDYNHYTGTVTLPSGLKIKPGDKRLRVVNDYYNYNPEPAGAYDYGETEDYTLTVVTTLGTPSTDINKEYVEATANNESVTTSIEISNNGDGKMTGTVVSSYVLPDAPTANYFTGNKAPTSNNSNRIAAAEEGALTKADFQVKKNIRTAAPTKAASDDATQYVLRYDGEQYGTIGITNYENATYASYYPGSMVKALKGMKINSVDVYIGNAPASASIVIYGQKDQNHAGELLQETVFSPAETSWNHITLNTPVEISDQDLWVGVKMSGFKSGDYNMGIDNESAIVGFGDLVNIGGTTWWSMSDLGYPYNYNIRANVVGDRTPAINWLTLDKEEINIDANTKGTLSLTLDPKNLDGNLYEAYVEISTNDELCPTTKIPVYLILGSTTGIYNIPTANTKVNFADGIVKIVSGKNIATITLTDLSGRVVRQLNVNEKQASISLEGMGNTVLLMSVKHTDGSRYAVKFTSR